MKLTLTAYLLIALGLSLLGNAFLGWQWAGAKAECRADMEKAARIAIDNERKRADKAGRQAADITAKAHSDTLRAVTALLRGANARDDSFRAVPVTGTCRMPDTPSLRPAVDAANAAAR